jgi:superfamily I DNA/RNA helicase
MAHGVVLKIEGPPGSGKTRELARQACRLVAQEGVPAERILLLAASRRNQERLNDFLRQEAGHAGLEAVQWHTQTLDAFLLGCLNALSADKRQFLLHEETASTLLYGLMQRLPQETPFPEPLLEAKSLCNAVLELFQHLQLRQITPENLIKVLNQAPTASTASLWLGELYQQWLQALQRLNLLPKTRLVQELLEYSNSELQAVCKHDVLLADEVQDWSEAHHHFFAKLPVQLVLAGHPGFSVRPGAAPDAFASMQAYPDRKITRIPLQTCLRGLEPALAMLNHLLPQSIGEAPDVDKARLQDCVQFAYYQDPQQEANALALRMKAWLQKAEAEDPPASWNDCVVLLRSAYYEPYLTNAFLEHGVPFRSEVLSESVIQVQHGLFDLLSVFESLEALGLTDGSTGENFSTGLSAVQVAERIRQANRHTRRWLEFTLKDEIILNWKDFDSEKKLLIPSLLNSEQTPLAARDEIRRLLGWYLSYREKQCVSSLLARLEAEWLPDLKLENPSSAQVFWKRLIERLDAWEARYQQGLSSSLRLAEVLANYALLWEIPDEERQEHAKQPQVKVMSFYAMQGEEAPFVAIPFMVADEIPQNRHLVELLDEAMAECLDVNRQQDLSAEARLLALGMSRASRFLWLSAHQSDQGDREKPVLPSPFFMTLLNAKRKLLGQSASSEVCGCKRNACDLDACGFREQTTTQDDAFFNRYCGRSLWASCERAAEEALFGKDEVLSMSASAIHTYMNCPRQFYYRHLLQIKPPSTEAAQLGTIIHRVMEVFNKNAGTRPYTAEALKKLADCLVRFAEDPEEFSSAGFGPRDRQSLEELNPLALDSLKQRLFASIEDLERKGYFATYADAKTVQAEKKLEQVAIDGIDRCRFKGSLDALIQRGDGTWDILDYKTYRSAYGKGLDTCKKHFSALLEPLPDAPDLSRAERFGDRLNTTYPKDYQLPLYYLACAQQPEYQDKIRSVALQMVRPEFPENPLQGSIRLELTAEAIEAAKEQLIADINNHIVNPILAASSFEANPVGGCDHCSYVSICDTAIVGEEGEAVEA